jgi:hypothetical protein
MYYEMKAAMKFNPWLCIFPLGSMTTHAAPECDIAHATKGEISAWDP